MSQINRSTGWLNIDGQGLVLAGRIVAVGQAESAAMKRLLGAVPLSNIVGLTAGRKRKTILVLDSGHLVLTPLTLVEIESLLRENE